MRGMLPLAQRIHDEMPHPVDLLHDSLRHRLAVAQIRREPLSFAGEKEAVHRRAPVRHAQRRQLRATEQEWPVDHMRQRTDVARPAVLAVERELKNAPQILHRLRRRMHRDVAPAETKRAQIVEADDVIRVRVGEDHRVQLAHIFPQALRAEIRPRIHHPRAFRRLHMDRSPRAVVARIVRPAHRAIASHHRHPHRGPGAEEGDGEFRHRVPTLWECCSA